MKHVARFTALAVLVVGIAIRMWSQAPALSPRDSTRIAFNGQRISIAYGKPVVRGRRIFGGAVPYYKVWRTGDREATILQTDLDLEMDGAIVPRGAYSLYTIPTESRWKLIINKQTGQWGTVYDPRLDLARLDVVPKPMKTQAESLTFRLEKTGTEAGIIRMDWERTSLSIPFRVSREALVPSPRDSVELRLSDARVSVTYGRPSVRGRKIFGGVVPFGKVWRAGANAATEFSSTTDLRLGGAVVPKGRYSLYAIPGPAEWTIIVNKQTGQWGTVYLSRQDLARVKVAPRKLREPVEKFTIELVPRGDRSATMRLLWERTQISIPLQTN